MEVVPLVPNELNAFRFMRLPEVMQITGLKKTALYARIKEGAFPPPVPLGGHAVGWVADEVYGWARSRIAAARVTPAHPAARLAA